MEWPRGFQEVWVPRFRDNGTGCWKVVSLTHRQPLPPRKYSWHSFLLEAESTPGPLCDRKDFMSMKKPMIPAGIEPATFRFVARHLNHCATAVLTSREDQSVFMIISRSFLLRMRSVSDQSCRENQNKHFMFNNLLMKIIRCMR